MRTGSEATLKLHNLYLELKDLTTSRDLTIVEMNKRIGEIRLESINLSEDLRTQTHAVKQLITVVIDSRKSVDGANQQINETAVKLEKFAKDISGEFPVAGPEDAPRPVHIVITYVTNFTWKYRKAVQRTAIAGATGVWVWAAPHVYAAVKLLWSVR